MKDKKILIIDDDPQVAESLKTPLEASGAVVSAVQTYAAGIDAIKNGHPDAIILDVMLKEEKTGLDLAKEVLTMPPPHPFIMILTNSINPDGIADAMMESGVTMFLQKAENDPSDIASMIAKHFDHKTD